MKFFILLILLSAILDKVCSFTIQTNSNTLLSWKNFQGIQEKLLVSQLQISSTTNLIKKQSLPYSFLVDQNCQIIQSLQKANIYSPLTQYKYKLQYTYLSGAKVIEKKAIQFTKDILINLNNLYSVKIDSPQIEKNMQSKDLYIYNNQTLVKIDPKIYFQESSCYLLSRMTPNLCREKQCVSLSPENIYQMEIGNVVQVSSNVNGQLSIKESNEVTRNSSKLQISLNMLSEDGKNAQFQGLTAQNNVSFSMPTEFDVQFQILDQYKKTQSKQQKSLQIQEINQEISYNIKITVKNLKPVYSIKTVKISYGQQKSNLEDEVLFKSLMSKEYEIIWRNNHGNTPSVYIYNQKMELEKKFSMNNFISFAEDTSQQNKIKNQQNVPQINNNQVQSLTIIQDNQPISLKLILIAVGGGLILIVFIILILCRNKIKQRLFHSSKSQTNQQQQVQKQSGRQIIDKFQFTFKKQIKQQNIIDAFNSASTYDKSVRSIPEYIQNRNQCSIQEYMQDQIVQASIKADLDSMKQTNECDEYLPEAPQICIKSNPQPIHFKKRKQQFHEQISNSNTVSTSQSYSRKTLKKGDGTNSIKQQQQTQNV